MCVYVHIYMRLRDRNGQNLIDSEHSICAHMYIEYIRSRAPSSIRWTGCWRRKVWRRLTGGRAKRRCQSKLERLVRVLFGSHLRGRGIQTVCSISPSEERDSRVQSGGRARERRLQLEGNCCCYRRFIRTIARPINESAPQALDGCPPVRPKRKPSVSVGFTTAAREESASAALDESLAFIRDARGIPRDRLFSVCVSLSLSL